MFTIDQRRRLTEALVDAARADERIDGAALTGSAASGTDDEWSDIDLGFGLVPGADLDVVLADWTDQLYREHGAVHHTDVSRGGTIYRVFLLDTTLQVDLAFSPAAEFGPIAPTFRLLFGEAREQAVGGTQSAADLIGLAWLYALHARSSIARGRGWQAEYMISGMRDHALALACLRHGLPRSHGRGLHELPPETVVEMEPGLVRSLQPSELVRAFRAVTAVLVKEIEHADPALAARLAGPLTALTT